MKSLYIINKKNHWYCQRQKTSRILLASDFVMWTVRYILDLVFCFSYTDYKLICYLLLMLITLHNSTVNINTYQNAYLPTLIKDLEFIHICVICLAKTNINYENTSKWLLPNSYLLLRNRESFKEIFNYRSHLLVHKKP